MHTLVVQVYALAGHAPVGTYTCVSAIDLVHGLVSMHAAQPSVWHFSALVCSLFLFWMNGCYVIIPLALVNIWVCLQLS